MTCSTRPADDGTPESRARVVEHEAGCEFCQLAQSNTLPSLDGPMKRSAGQVAGTGDRLGKYILLDRIGKGGMGTVYAAYDPPLDRKVALKLVDTEPGQDAEASGLREAQALARLAHPNIVAVHDAGTSDGQLFIAMELITGVTLRSWLTEKPRGWREVLGVFTEAAKGMVAIHRAGLAHLDFKPENVLIDAHGQVKITDFGLARVFGARSSRVGPGQALPGRTLLGGTPGYMPPEQWLGQAPDARADQFAFCAALFEGLYGRLPHGQASLATLPPNGLPEVPSRELSPPPRVKRALLRGLAARPEERFESMQALTAELHRALARPRWPWLVAAAVGLLSLLAGAALRTQGRDADLEVQVRAKSLLEQNAASTRRMVGRYCTEAERVRAYWPAPGPSRGSDAAIFLATRMTWEREGGRPSSPPGTLELPLPLKTRLFSPNPDGGAQRWLKETVAEDLASVDFSWMTELEAFQQWSLVAAGPLAPRTSLDWTFPMPVYVPLFQWVKLRYARGMLERDMASALLDARRVRDLVRTNGPLVSEMIAISLSKLERDAVSEAQGRGLDVDGSAGMDASQFSAARRVTMASRNFVMPGVDEATMRRALACTVSPCAALSEAAMWHATARSLAPADTTPVFWELARSAQCDVRLLEALGAPRPLDAEFLSGVLSAAVGERQVTPVDALIDLSSP